MSLLILTKRGGGEMTKTIFRVIRKKDNKMILFFGDKDNAEKISKRLDFETFIEKVILDDEGKVLHNI